MLDRDCYRGLRLGANPNRPPYDSTKYQQGDIESTDNGLDQDRNVDDATGCDIHNTVTVVEQDSLFQGGDADSWHKQMSDRSDVTNIADDNAGATKEPGTVTVNHLSSCSEQPARNTTRLEYFKRRRTQLLNKQRKLKMLQHDLYDTLVKLQALLSGDASSPLEDKAARLTCLVAEVCAIQLQAQEIHEAGRRSNHPKSHPLQHNHKHKHAVQHNSAKLKTNRKAAQTECLDHSAGHGLHVAHMGELIMQALQSSTWTHDSQRTAASGAIKSQQHSKGDMGSSECSKATEDPQPSRPHGKPTRISQVSPAELQACRQGRMEQRGDTLAGSRDHAIGGAASEMEETGSPGLARQPEATLGRWHRRGEEAGDHNSLSRLSSSELAADKLHMDTQAHDGRCDRLLTMLQAELVLQGCHAGGQEPLQSQLLSSTVNARPGAFRGQADTRSPTTRPATFGGGSRLKRSVGAALSSRPPVEAVQESGFSPQQPAHGRGPMRGPRQQADWDSSISAVVDPHKVVKTRSGLRPRPPTRPVTAAAAARPMSAYTWSNRPTTAATVAGSERPASRLGVGSRSQKQGMQPWDQGSRGIRRPDWDDRFIVPEQQRRGRRQVEGMAPVHAFRASTPGRVLKENLPRRKQQHPWLSKRARQLRGQEPQPRSRRAASVPNIGPESFGSLPNTTAHPRTGAEPLGSHENTYPGPGVENLLSSAVDARSKGSAEEMPDSGIWPNGVPGAALAQSAAHQQHPGLGLLDEAASQAHVEHISGSQHGAASQRGQQDEQGSSLCDRHLKERLDVNLRHSEVQKHSSGVQSFTARAASGRLGAGSILGGAVSAEPLLAQLEDMEARMKAMMSTIESRLYGNQGGQ